MKLVYKGAGEKMPLDPQLSSSVQRWLGQELEMRGIDAVIYTRYILSILQQDTSEFDPGEENDFLFPGKLDACSKSRELGMRTRGRYRKGDKCWGLGKDDDELKKTAAVECLLSVSDEASGIEGLVDELYTRLKQQKVKREESNKAETSQDVESGGQIISTSPEDPAERYYAAFPALSDKCDELTNKSAADTRAWAAVVTDSNVEPSATPTELTEKGNDDHGDKGKSSQTKSPTGKPGNSVKKGRWRDGGRDFDGKGLTNKSQGRESRGDKNGKYKSSPKISPRERFHQSKGVPAEAVQGKLLSLEISGANHHSQFKRQGIDRNHNRADVDAALLAFVIPRVKTQGMVNHAQLSMDGLRDDIPGKMLEQSKVYTTDLSEVGDSDSELGDDWKSLLAYAASLSGNGKVTVAGMWEDSPELEFDMEEDNSWYTEPIASMVAPSPGPTQRLYKRKSNDTYDVELDSCATEDTGSVFDVAEDVGMEAAPTATTDSSSRNASSGNQIQETVTAGEFGARNNCAMSFDIVNNTPDSAYDLAIETKYTIGKPWSEDVEGPAKTNNLEDCPALVHSAFLDELIFENSEEGILDTFLTFCDSCGDDNESPSTSPSTLVSTLLKTINLERVDTQTPKSSQNSVLDHRPTFYLADVENEDTGHCDIQPHVNTSSFNLFPFISPISSVWTYVGGPHDPLGASKGATVGNYSCDNFFSNSSPLLFGQADVEPSSGKGVGLKKLLEWDSPWAVQGIWNGIIATETSSVQSHAFSPLNSMVTADSNSPGLALSSWSNFTTKDVGGRARSATSFSPWQSIIGADNYPSLESNTPHNLLKQTGLADSSDGDLPSQIWDVNIQKRPEIEILRDRSGTLEEIKDRFIDVHFELSQEEGRKSAMRSTTASEEGFIEGGLYGTDWVGGYTDSSNVKDVISAADPWIVADEMLAKHGLPPESLAQSASAPQLVSEPVLPSQNSAFSNTVPPRMTHVQSEPILSPNLTVETLEQRAEGGGRQVQIRHLYNIETSILRDLGLAAGSDNEAMDLKAQVEYSPERHFKPITAVLGKNQENTMVDDAIIPLPLDLDTESCTTAVSSRTESAGSGYQLYQGEETEVAKSFVPRFRVNNGCEKSAQTGDETRGEEEQQRGLTERLLHDMRRVLTIDEEEEEEDHSQELTMEDIDSSLVGTPVTPVAKGLLENESDFNTVGIAGLWQESEEIPNMTEIPGDDTCNKYRSIWSVNTEQDLPSLPGSFTQHVLPKPSLMDEPEELDLNFDDVFPNWGTVEQDSSKATVSSEDKIETEEPPPRDDEPEWFSADPFDVFDEGDGEYGTQLIPYEVAPVPRPYGLYSSDLEEQWLSSDQHFEVQVPKKRPKRKIGLQRKPCSFFLEGNCRRSDCKFAHDMSRITCRFWEEGECFKGITCPFLHGYYSELRKEKNVKDNDFSLEKEDFPDLSKSEEDGYIELETFKPNVKARRADMSEKTQGIQASCRRGKDKNKPRSLPIDITFKRK